MPHHLEEASELIQDAIHELQAHLIRHRNQEEHLRMVQKTLDSALVQISLLYSELDRQCHAHAEH